MNKLKITTVGNSTGVVLPKDILQHLHVNKGDTLYVVETPNGIELTAYNPQFAAQMETAEQIMREDRDVLKSLPSNNHERADLDQDDVVRAIHNRQLSEHGGQEGIRDKGLLASALARQRTSFSILVTNPT